MSVPGSTVTPTSDLSLSKSKPDLNKPLPKIPRKPVPQHVSVFELGGKPAQEVKPKPSPSLDIELTREPRLTVHRSNSDVSMAESTKRVVLSYWCQDEARARARLTWLFDGPAPIYQTARHSFWVKTLQKTAFENNGLTQEEVDLVTNIAKMTGQRIFVPLVSGENVWVPAHEEPKPKAKTVERPSTSGSGSLLIEGSGASDPVQCGETFTHFDDSEAPEDFSPVSRASSAAYSFRVGDSLRFGKSADASASTSKHAAARSYSC